MTFGTERAVGTCSLCSGLVVMGATGLACSRCGAVPRLPVIPMQPAGPAVEPVIGQPVPVTVPWIPQWAYGGTGGGSVGVTVHGDARASAKALRDALGSYGGES